MVKKYLKLVCVIAVLVALVYLAMQIRTIQNNVREVQQTTVDQAVALHTQAQQLHQLTISADAINSALWLEVAALNEHIDSLPLIVLKVSPAEKVPEPVPYTGWRARLYEAWLQLKSFIVIRQHADEVAPLVASQAGDYIYQYIHLQLGMAEWAVLHHDNAVYQQSLQQAHAWVDRYFVATNTQTQQLKEQLTALQNRLDVSA